MVRISIQEYNRLIGKRMKQKKESKKYKTICPVCNLPIKFDDSFIAEEVDGKLIKRHLSCGLKVINT